MSWAILEHAYFLILLHFIFQRETKKEGKEGQEEGKKEEERNGEKEREGGRKENIVRNSSLISFVGLVLLTPLGLRTLPL